MDKLTSEEKFALSVDNDRKSHKWAYYILALDADDMGYYLNYYRHVFRNVDSSDCNAWDFDLHVLGLSAGFSERRAIGLNLKGLLVSRKVVWTLLGRNPNIQGAKLDSFKKKWRSTMESLEVRMQSRTRLGELIGQETDYIILMGENDDAVTFDATFMQVKAPSIEELKS